MLHRSFHVSDKLHLHQLDFLKSLLSGSDLHLMLLQKKIQFYDFGMAD
jgi:hypothetical protein